MSDLILMLSFLPLPLKLGMIIHDLPMFSLPPFLDDRDQCVGPPILAYSHPWSYQVIDLLLSALFILDDVGTGLFIICAAMPDAFYSVALFAFSGILNSTLNILEERRNHSYCYIVGPLGNISQNKGFHQCRTSVSK